MDYTKIISLVIILLESISMLICFHISFGKKIRVNIRNILFVLVYVSFYYIKSIKGLDMIFSILAIIVMFVWVIFAFKCTFIQTVVRYIIGAIAPGVIQTIVLFVFKPIIQSDNERDVANALVIVGLISLFISYVIYVLVIRDKEDVFVKKPKIYNLIYIVFACLFLVCIKIDFESTNAMHALLYIMCFLTIVLFVVGVLREQRATYELEKKQIELNLRKVYDSTYKDLLDEVRRKQHDYKNQISALYSMHLVASTLEELVSMQKEYGESILENNNYNEVITGCKSQIIAGYIYNKCLQAEKSNIKLKVKIRCSQDEYKISISEIIEILGILLDNAREYLCDSNVENKVIQLTMIEENENLLLDVSNQAEYIKNSEIEKMFKLGYSTKGDNRGIGLSSLRKIVNKYKGNIIVENIEDKEVNWIRFKILLNNVL